MNSRPADAAVQTVTTLLSDTWVVAGTGDGYTYPAHLTNPPNRRIDFIFASQNVTIPQINVVATQKTRETSDHYPVGATIELPGSEVGIGRKP